ncbi:hypothetical protein RFI_17700 [Reticulomyxa filosa]|uniref:Transmembrane protein n=1 Tax=Reticulomyxa filosa TaxID=46433 RepID=X6N1D3_RETFI|nr:hypothetical protein RFI_17700 [Reticulomyxa filosa]|eukprot:ETO19534.1 hypothetical protein RFI_17700 [Reticulomyxa filosa]
MKNSNVFVSIDLPLRALHVLLLIASVIFTAVVAIALTTNVSIQVMYSLTFSVSFLVAVVVFIAIRFLQNVQEMISWGKSNIEALERVIVLHQFFWSAIVLQWCFMIFSFIVISFDICAKQNLPNFVMDAQTPTFRSFLLAQFFVLCKSFWTHTHCICQTQRQDTLRNVTPVTENLMYEHSTHSPSQSGV